MRLATAAKLGRISNLPSVWTNVLAGCVLAGAACQVGTLVRLGLIGSLLYVGGMILNDVCDADIDAHARPERPIPAGEVSRATALHMAIAVLGLALLLALGLGLPALLATAATALTIVAYDVHHKQVSYAPVLMGLCRAGLYAIAAFALVEQPPARVWLGAAVLLAYVLALTCVAKLEDDARVRAGVGVAIAGISLVDALLIWTCGSTELAVWAVAGFVLTLALQRVVAGT